MKAGGPEIDADRIWLYRLVVVLLPVLVLWRQDNSLFPPPGQVDTWVYLGYFRNLVEFKRNLFPDLYYGSRLTLVLPGWAIHSVLPAVTAEAVLHLMVLWTALLSLFETMRLTMGARAALLTTLMFSANPQLWYAIGWDYFDGIGIAYCLLTLALLTAAAMGRSKPWILTLAGAGIAALVYSNLIWVVFVPVLALYYASLARMQQGRRAALIAADLVLGCGAGFLAVTAALCAINHAIDGAWWFYAPSLQSGSQLNYHRDWSVNVWTRHGLTSWLWFPVLGAVAACYRIGLWLRTPRPERRGAPLVMSIQYLILAALFCYLQPTHYAVLTMSYYSSLLVPFAFLVIGCTFWSGVDEMSGRGYAALCGTAALLGGIVWCDYAGDWTPIWPDAIPAVLAAGGLTLAAALLVRFRSAGIVLAAGGLALFSSETRFLPAKQLTVDPRTERPAGPHAYREMFARVMADRAWIESVRVNLPVRFAYDPGEPAAADFAALNATYLYMYTQWPGHFPVLACNTAPDPGTLLVTASMRADAAVAARLGAGVCAARGDLRLVDAGTRSVAHPKGSYTISLLRMERDSARRWLLRPAFEASGKAVLEPAPGPETAAAFPGSGWRALGENLGMRLHVGASQVELTTPKAAHASAASYGPLVAPETGRYTFNMRYRASSEGFVFGIRSLPDLKWLWVDGTGHREGLDRGRQCQVDLEAGREFRIEIANSTPRDESTSLVILGLTAEVTRK